MLESYFLFFALLPATGDLHILVFDDGAEVGVLRNIVSTILVQWISRYQQRVTHRVLKSNYLVLSERKAFGQSLEVDFELSDALLVAEVAVNASVGVLDGGL